MAPRSRSVRSEVLAGFATLIMTFGAVALYALVRQRSAVAAVRLADESYQRLNERLAEMRANQGIMNTLVDRIIDERDRVNSRTWIGLARRARRARTAEARQIAVAGLGLARAPEDQRLLRRAVAVFDDVDASHLADEPRFERFFRALSTSELTSAAQLRDEILGREGRSEDALARLMRELQVRVERLADDAEAQQRESLRLLAIALFVACALGALTALRADLALRPLALLRDRARAVARGDLADAPVPARDDEIGELAREFDRMVHAVGARDADLRRANTELRAAERHLEQVVSSLRAAVLVVRGDRVIASANASAQRFEGRPGLEGAALDSTRLGGAPALREAVDAALAGSVTSREAVPVGERAFDVSAAPFVMGEDGAAGALVVADDVTEREQARRRLLQAERLAAIGRMAAHVTHEVRNPLSSMALNAEMLADELRAPDRAEAERLLRAIQREIDRLTGLTEEYLRVARLPRPRLEREDLGAIVLDAASFVSGEMRGAGVELITRIARDLPAVMLDESQLRQSLLNLLRNARESIEGAAGPRRCITLDVSAYAGGVQVAVSDSGPGVSPHAREHLFELFFTTRARGTGLGLPLTREIVSAHGGTIEVGEAAECDGAGARFVIWLPAAPAARGSEEDARET
jgi:nitrogen fixation/metabolism regulation signal transduction histidine kinase